MKIVFVGLSGVPYAGRACDSRLANIANMLSEEASVELLNRYSSLGDSTLSGIELYENVVCKEIIAPRRTKGLFTLIFYVLSLLKEPYDILQSHRREKIDWLHLYTGHYIDFVIYRIIAKLIGAKIVYEYVEYRSDKPAKGIYHRLNNYLCDFHGAKLWDSCIAISNYLQDVALKVNPELPIIKVTPIGDFDLFRLNHHNVSIQDEYVMFCGHAGYFDVVKLIIDSFNASTISKSKKLLLVLGGSLSQVEQISEYDKHCIIKSKLPYDELIALYKHAFALMIPLRDTMEDIARFPNKICEYTAAHGLIITTNNGEMKYYFKNGENALVADECSVSSIANRLDELEKGKYDIEKIKDNAYTTGIDNFSIHAYKHKLYNFLNENHNGQTKNS